MLSKIHRSWLIARYNKALHHLMLDVIGNASFAKAADYSVDLLNFTVSKSHRDSTRSNITLAFSCGARSAFELEEKSSLRIMLSRRHRLSYSIANYDVVICEERPLRNQSSEWIKLDIAKLRYVRKRDEWQLHWKRASGKWWPYAPHRRSKTLEAMIKEIDLDSDGCFFG